MRRSLPFLRQGPKPLRSPLELADLAFWYDPYDLSTLTLDGSNRVSLWADKSPWSRVNGLVLNGATGQGASSPDASVLRATALVDIRVRCALNAYSGTTWSLAGRWQGGGNLSYVFYVGSDGEPHMAISPDGSSSNDRGSGVALGLAPFTEIWLRGVYDSVSSQHRFYTSSDYDADAETGTWTPQGGTPTTGGVISAGGAPLWIGNTSAGNASAAGTIKRVQVYNSGVKVFDADFTAQSKLAASFTESSSNAATVTINTSGATGARIIGARDLYWGTVAGQPVYSVVDGVPRLTFDGSDDALKSPQFPFAQPCIVQGAFSQVSWALNGSFFDGSTDASLWLLQNPSSPEISISAGGVVTNTSLGIGETAAISASFNGASSSLRVNLGAPVVGDAGSAAANGFTLASRGVSGSTFGNITAGEIVGRSSLAATSIYEQERVIRYLARRGRIAA